MLEQLALMNRVAIKEMGVGYDRNGSIPSRNRNWNLGIPILVGLTGAEIFRITSGSGQTGTKIFFL
jgi:hypothetical protein